MKIIALLLAFALLAGGCSSLASGDGSTVIVLLDVTASTGSDVKLQDQLLMQILQGTEPGGEVLIFPITSTPLKSSLHIKAEIPRSSWWNPNATKANRQREFERLRQNVIRDVNNQLRQYGPAERGSAILETIGSTAPFFNDCPKCHHSLVIISDMIQQPDPAGAKVDSVGLDFTANPPVDPEGSIARLRTAGQMPQLKAVDLWVAGISDGEGANREVDAKVVERFWRQFFQQAGATVRWYNRELSGFTTRPQGK